MIRTALLILATVVALASSPPAARAANPPFTWATFPTANGNQSFPQWLDAGNGNRTLVSATGTLNFAQTPAVTAVTFQVFTQGPQGGWNATPVINYPSTRCPSLRACRSTAGPWSAKTPTAQALCSRKVSKSRSSGRSRRPA